MPVDALLEHLTTHYEKTQGPSPLPPSESPSGSRHEVLKTDKSRDNWRGDISHAPIWPGGGEDSKDYETPFETTAELPIVRPNPKTPREHLAYWANRADVSIRQQLYADENLRWFYKQGVRLYDAVRQRGASLVNNAWEWFQEARQGNKEYVRGEMETDDNPPPGYKNLWKDHDWDKQDEWDTDYDPSYGPYGLGDSFDSKAASSGASVPSQNTDLPVPPEVREQIGGFDPTDPRYTPLQSQADSMQTSDSHDPTAA